MYNLLLKWIGDTRSAFVVDNLLVLWSSDFRSNLSEDETSLHFVRVQHFDNTFDRLVTGMRLIAQSVQTLQSRIEGLTSAQLNMLLAIQKLSVTQDPPARCDESIAWSSNIVLGR